MSQKGMQILSHFGYLLPGFSFQSFEFCDHCVYGKQTQTSRKSRGSRHSSILELVHSDLFGPMPCLSLGGSMYCCTFIDDYSCKVSIYFWKHKNNVLEVLKKFLHLVENQSGHIHKCLRNDNGGEYISKTFQGFCDAKDIN